MKYQIIFTFPYGNEHARRIAIDNAKKLLGTSECTKLTKILVTSEYSDMAWKAVVLGNDEHEISNHSLSSRQITNSLQPAADQVLLPFMIYTNIPTILISSSGSQQLEMECIIIQKFQKCFTKVNLRCFEASILKQLV